MVTASYKWTAGFCSLIFLSQFFNLLPFKIVTFSNSNTLNKKQEMLLYWYISFFFLLKNSSLFFFIKLINNKKPTNTWLHCETRRHEGPKQICGTTFGRTVLMKIYLSIYFCTDWLSDWVIVTSLYLKNRERKKKEASKRKIFWTFAFGYLVLLLHTCILFLLL